MIRKQMTWVERLGNAVVLDAVREYNQNYRRQNYERACEIDYEMKYGSGKDWLEVVHCTTKIWDNMKGIDWKNVTIWKDVIYYEK